MNLYTVIIEFEDRSSGIDQFEAESPEQALVKFIRHAESLQDYDRNGIELTISGRLRNRNLLIQIANDLRGFWIIDFGLDLVEIEEFSSIFGGYIIQTDKAGPKRAK